MQLIVLLLFFFSFSVAKLRFILKKCRLSSLLESISCAEVLFHF
jgi:hypothetical protein